MLERLIDFTLDNRLPVLFAFVCAAGAGVWAVTRIPVDAFPDTTPVQVQVNTVAPALNPEEAEVQISIPIEQELGGLPGLVNLRSVSKFGFSQVVATFDDSVDVYQARQFVSERLASVELPEGIERPVMGPISSGLGEVFHYLVRSSDPDRRLDELHILHERVIKPALRRVSGVAEVNTWGGLERRYEVVPDPEELLAYGLTLRDVVAALEANNQNVGGGQITTSGESLLLHGIGRVSTLDEIGGIVLRSTGGLAVRIRDVADVRIGHAIRRGAITAQGQGEAILGLGFMLLGENSKTVTERLSAALDNVRGSLPPDVQVEVVYARTELVSHVLRTVRHNLIAGAVLVVLVLLLVFRNLRAAVLVAVSIPLAMLFAACGMYGLSIAASLLSLGAIDFGIIVDGAVVMTEINLRRLAERSKGGALSWAERLEVIRTSSKEMVRPIVFGMGIIIVVFLPVLTLQGMEGKLFRPMAWTFLFALAGALLLAVFVSPILSYYLLSRGPRVTSGMAGTLLGNVYERVLEACLRFRVVAFVATGAVLAGAIFLATRIGGEFIPRLNEGAFAINVIRLAGISIDESVDSNTRLERLLLAEFPNEIEHIWSRIGTAEVATDPMGIELTDVFVALRPRAEWTRASTQDELAAEMARVLDRFPGKNAVISQPIEMRINEMVAGMRGDVGIKIYGESFEKLEQISNRVQEVLLDIPGTADVSGDQITGQPALRVAVKPDAVSRHGVPAREVLDVVESVGGLPAGTIFVDGWPYPVAVRLPDAHRSEARVLMDSVFATSTGPRLPLRDMADLVEGEMPTTINREWGRRVIRVQTNVRGRDVASFVREAQERVAREVQLPEGYVLEWGGQFENLEQARNRLAIVVPITLALVFALLCFSLNSLRDVLIIYSGIPLAVIGGVVALYLRGLPFSVSAAIGFIALAGLSVLNGQVMIGALRAHCGVGKQTTAVIAGARERLRPVLATSITDVVGFLPMAVSTGIGAEVQRPLATVVIGGLITSTLLTLVLLPAFYYQFAKAPAIPAESRE